MFANLEHAADQRPGRDLRIVVVGAAPPASRPPERSPRCATTTCRSCIPSSTAARIHIVLVEMMPTGARRRSTRSCASTPLKSLQKRGVDLRLETAVKEVREDGVLVEKDGEQEFLPAGIVVWASGVTAPDGRPTGASRRAAAAGSRPTSSSRQRATRTSSPIGDVSIGPERCRSWRSRRSRAASTSRS